MREIWKTGERVENANQMATLHILLRMPMSEFISHLPKAKSGGERTLSSSQDYKYLHSER